LAGSGGGALAWLAARVFCRWLSRRTITSGRWLGRTLGALVFRPLDRHGNAIMGGRTQVPPTRIAGRAVSRAGGPTVGKTFLPKRTLAAQTERRTGLPLEPQKQAKHWTCQRQGIDSPVCGRHNNPAQRNRTRETGLGVLLPCFLCSND
jgi:hypothetical protein